MAKGLVKFGWKTWNHAPGQGVSDEAWERTFGKKPEEPEEAPEADEQDCTPSPDGTHCKCWWDDESAECHYCAVKYQDVQQRGT
jgi:hypothetical protein